MSLRLVKTKTGTNQWVDVQSGDVVMLLRTLLHDIHAHQLVFDFSANQYRHIFHLVCSSLGLGSVGYVPHSLRHGGATRDFMLGMPVEDVLLRGRWQSTKTARIYIQTGRALLLSVSVSDHLYEIANRLTSNLPLSITMAYSQFLNTTI